jgi:hypothetical protein
MPAGWITFEFELVRMLIVGAAPFELSEARFRLCRQGAFCCSPAALKAGCGSRFSFLSLHFNSYPISVFAFTSPHPFENFFSSLPNYFANLFLYVVVSNT